MLPSAMTLKVLAVVFAWFSLSACKNPLHPATLGGSGGTVLVAGGNKPVDAGVSDAGNSQTVKTPDGVACYQIGTNDTTNAISVVQRDPQTGTSFAGQIVVPGYGYIGAVCGTTTMIIGFGKTNCDPYDVSNTRLVLQLPFNAINDILGSGQIILGLGLGQASPTPLSLSYSENNLTYGNCGNDTGFVTLNATNSIAADSTWRVQMDTVSLGSCAFDGASVPPFEFSGVMTLTLTRNLALACP